MKKIIIVTMTLMVFGFTNAQKTRFGVKGGGNVSNLSGDLDNMDFKSRIGFNIGVFAEIQLSEKFSIQPEALYSQQGGKLNFTIYTLDIPRNQFKAETKFNLAYINVPIMFKYYAVKNLAIEAGPQIGFLMSAKAKTKVDGINQATEMNISSAFKSVDFGLNLGVGYDFTESIFVAARYNLGLANIAKTETGDEGKVHNRVFSLSMGYKF